MNFKTGEVVYISHYSRNQASETVILEAPENYLKIKLTKDFAAFDMLKGDPVIIGYGYDGEACICECFIIEVNPGGSNITLEIKDCIPLSDKRLSENYPVSIYSDIKIKDSKKRYAAIVKNMNLTGMNVYLKQEMGEGEEIEIDVYLDKRVVSLRAAIIWKAPACGYTEYGLKIIYSDFNDKNHMKLYLQLLKEDQCKAISNLRNG